MSEAGSRRLEGQAGRGPRPRLITAGLLALGCAILAALILTNRASIVTRGPGLADARLNAIWSVVRNEAATTADLEEANRKTLNILRREPLNSIAVSLAANIRFRQGRAAEGEALMMAAQRVNHRENMADLWLFDHLLARKDYAGAFRAADALLRREREFTQQLFPVLTSSLNDPNAVPELAKRLAKSPGWRPVFTEAIGRSTTDPQAVFSLLAAIKSAGGDVTHDEMSNVVTRLISARRFEEAYLDWLILMPDEATSKVAYVYDGAFESLPDARPFGWNLNSAGGAYIEPAQGRTDEALHVLYSGAADRDFATQLVIIPPGHYRLTGEILTSNRTTSGQLAWQLLCADQARSQLMSAPATESTGQWRAFSVAFTVPGGCPAQSLVLKRATTNRAPEIDVWYDKLIIRPTGDAP